jgi:hypothetical protein
MIDSTIIRAHQHAFGILKNTQAGTQGLGKSKGGLSSKRYGIPWVTPLDFFITSG